MKRLIAALIAGLAAALAAAPSPAAAQSERSLDTAFAVSPGTRFELHSFAGEADIRGTRRRQIRIQAEYERGQIEIDVSRSVVSVRPSGRYGMHDVTFTIELPVGTPLTANAVTGDITVGGVCGEAELHSASGDIELECGRGNVTLETAAGDVTASDITGRLDASSAAGDVSIQNAQADVTARSASGDIDLDGVEGDEVSAETVSGEVTFAGPIRDGGRYRFQSHSGDVTVQPENRNLNATVSVSTFSGDLDSDYPITLTQGRRLRGREFEFTVGTGSARVILSSFSGTIYLRQGGAHRRTGESQSDRDRSREDTRSRDPKQLEIRP